MTRVILAFAFAAFAAAEPQRLGGVFFLRIELDCSENFRAILRALIEIPRPELPSLLGAQSKSGDVPECTGTGDFPSGAPLCRLTALSVLSFATFCDFCGQRTAQSCVFFVLLYCCRSQVA